MIKNTVLAFIILITSQAYAMTNNQEDASSKKHTPNTPQTIQASNNAPFLKQGETVLITGDNKQHNYVDDMNNMEIESLFQKYSILLIGVFLFVSILICSCLFFYVSKKHKNEEGIIKD